MQRERKGRDEEAGREYEGTTRLTHKQWTGQLHVLQVFRADVESGSWSGRSRPQRRALSLSALRHLFQSGEAIRPLPLSASPADSLRSVQKHGLPLQARARPLARPRMAGNTTCRARGDFHGFV